MFDWHHLLKTKIQTAIILMMIFFLSEHTSAKKPIIPNGYYISRSGDTIYGHLRIKESMYLIVRTIDGKRKKFTPSKIKGFKLAWREYIPLHLEEFNTKRFMAVKVNGYCSLYSYEDVAKYSLNGMAGIAGAAVEGSFKAHNSGFYIKKDDDENYYSVPSADKLLKKFLIKHFGDNTEFISNLENKDLIDNIESMVVNYNKWYKYIRPSEE